jgi:glycosyltransferase involved in cell wall biosynthesis
MAKKRLNVPDVIAPSAPNRPLSVIIPHRDGIDRLRLTLQALTTQTHSDFELIIVENGARSVVSEILNLVELLGLDARVLHCAEQGAGPARNLGAATAGGRVLAFLDADCRPAVDWAEKGLNSSRDQCVVGGPVLVQADHKDLNAPEAWDIMFGHNAEVSHRKHRHLLGGNMFVRRDVFSAVGPFRNDFPEDRDWCERATRQGFAIAFDSDLRVVHAPLTSYGTLRRRWLRMTREEYVRGCNRPYGRIKFAAHSLLVAGSIVPHGWRILTSRPEDLRAAKHHVVWLLVRLRLLRALCAWELLLTAKPARRA